MPSAQPACAEPAADVEETFTSAGDLDVEERAVLLRGLHSCDRGRKVDELAAEVMHNWPNLTPAERCAALSLIAALLATDVAGARQRTS